MQKKIIRRDVVAAQSFVHADLHPILQRIYAVRGITSPLELERNLDRLLPYHGLLNIDLAAARLALALQNQEKILIVGDFDADGATSTALAIRALKSFGAQHVDFLVPNRFAFGYGLTPGLVQVAIQEFAPQVIITVDNGIASHEGVTAAKAAGITVIITDHHLPALTLPEADVIVNPNQPDDKFASKNLAGVGVIFYVMLALRRNLTDLNWFKNHNIAEPTMSRFLDLVALGTVADVVPLDHNNRILVYQGLRRIRAGQCIPAITVLLELAGRNQQRLVATDLGFVVGPRLNAAGRLDDMALGINCLLTDDLWQAREMAAVLNVLNDERREIEQDMQEQALGILNALQPQQKTLPVGICLFDEKWHQGVIGILASRLKDRFHRPVIAFAPGADDEIKGSARSIPGLHIRDVLAQIASQSPQLIRKFGGHAMAAGLSLSRADFDTFASAFDAAVTACLTTAQLHNSVVSDGELQHQDLTLEVAEILREAGPWGQAFPEPVFDGAFQVLEQRLVGGRHLKLVLAQENFQQIDAIAFNVDLKAWPNHRCERIHAGFRVDVNEFRGRRAVQLIIEHLETVATE
ncbi:MAG: single-stranded-DNA-specific exonuclease RecJ [Pseudomonadota bacterium]